MSTAEGNLINPALLHEMESVINQLSGVMASKLVSDRKGTLIEVHVLYEGKRAPKYVAQDIQSLFETRWNLSIDKKIISVAQVGNNHKPPKPLRLQIQGIETRNRGLLTEISVDLGLNDVVRRGTASGPDTVTNKMRIVANASLYSIKQFLPEKIDFVLEAATIERVGHNEVVVACVTLLSPKQQETLVGTCVVERDLILSTIKAVLDSLNRRFGVLAAV